MGAVSGQELRALLEAAAKACGIFDLRFRDDGIAYRNVHLPWQPHLDDGDCARMEAARRLDVIWNDTLVMVADGCKYEYGSFENYADHNNDRQAARRWASLRAAAACAGKGE